MQRCVGRTELAALAAETLEASRQPVVQAHVQTCARCAAELAALPVFEALLTELRASDAARLADDAARRVARRVETVIHTTLFGGAG